MKKKKKPQPTRETGMIVRRETRDFMAEKWVRQIAQEEAWRTLDDFFSEKIKEINAELKRLRLDLDSLERRSGEFTGMTETETRDLVKDLVNSQVSHQSIHNMVDQVLHDSYGPRPIEHPSFRARLGISENDAKRQRPKKRQRRQAKLLHHD